MVKGIDAMGTRNEVGKTTERLSSFRCLMMMLNVFCNHLAVFLLTEVNKVNIQRNNYLLTYFIIFTVTVTNLELITFLTVDQLNSLRPDPTK